MDILKKGSQGEDVKELQRLLNAKGFNVAVDGYFGNEILRAVKAFQSQNLDKHGRSLVVDGKVGEITWWSLKNTEPIVVRPVIDYYEMPADDLGGSDVGRKALQCAIDEMKKEAREIGGDNSGEFVAKYLQPADLVPPESWCASFVSWCFLQAVGGDKADMPFNYSAGAKDIRNQFRDKGWTFDINDRGGKVPEPGDIVVWWRGVSISGWKGHIGLVHHCFDGFLYTIEGNKSPKVEGFDYKVIALKRLLGFGRAK